MTARLLAVTVLVVTGCSAPTAIQPPPSPMLLGADVSALERIERGGGVFRDGGRAGDAIAILRAHGSTIFRLRLFLNPSGDEVQVNDLDYTVRLAVRIKAAGARLLLDLHYSDTWADPGHQLTPAAWAGLGIDSLERRVETYTAGVITRLAAAGALPAIVQVGNEIDGGMLWPLGRVDGTSADTTAQWDRLARLVGASIRGVRSAVGAEGSVRIMLHYSQGGNVGGARWFFDHMAARQVPYDLIGLSYYPWWHGSLAGLTVTLRDAAQRYGRDVMVVETSYPWRAGGWESLAPSTAAMVWPVSAAGQAQFVRDLVDAVAAVPGGRGAGVVWWYPEAIEVPGLFVWGGGSVAWFDEGGNVLPAAGELGR